MTENIKSIFEHNISLLDETDKAVFYFREQRYDMALSIVVNAIDKIKFIVEAIIADRVYFNLVATESVLEMLSGILEAQKNKDYILLADLLELQLISFLCGVQELIISKEEIKFDEDNYNENINTLLNTGEGFPEQLKEVLDSNKLLESGYRVEFTSGGLMTLVAQNLESKFYFHTNNRVQFEAFLLAKRWLIEGKKKYILYGFGMGYHINELQQLAPDADIEVYEADKNVIQLACAFTDVKKLLKKKRVSLTYDPELKFLKERIAVLTPEDEFIVHFPSLMNIRSKAGREMMEIAVPWSKTIELC